MNILYADFGMGVAGDMFAGALLELAPDRAAALDRLNALGVPGVEFSAERVSKCGIAATRLSVKVHGGEEGCGHGHSHACGARSLEDVLAVVDALSADDCVKESVESVYRSIAAAESRAHGKPVGEIHFHEVGALDAIADIAAVSELMRLLHPDEVVASPVHVGCGTVKCEHGELPVPAPATAFLLDGIPSYSDGTVRGELCTPTGAALARRFVTRFAPQPAMRIAAVGHGAGSRDFPRANVLRVFYGAADGLAGAVARISKLEFDVDDMTGEEIAFAAERIFDSGAKDVSFSPVFMKKGRPGTRFTVLCRPENRDAALRAAFAETTTLGVRESECVRHELARREETVALPDGGSARRKVASRPQGEDSKFEADDIAALARREGISFFEARRLASLSNKRQKETIWQRKA